MIIAKLMMLYLPSLYSHAPGAARTQTGVCTLQVQQLDLKTFLSIAVFVSFLHDNLCV